MNSNQTTNLLLIVIAVALIVLLICNCLVGTDVVDPTNPPADPVFHFKAILTGANEVPPVTTNAFGTLFIRINEDSTGFFYELTIDSAQNILSSGGAHLHCAPDGRTGEIIMFLAEEIPGGVNGNFQISGDKSKFDIVDAVCGSNILELIASLNREGVYVNVHSERHPTGEIRGQVQPVEDK